MDAPYRNVWFSKTFPLEAGKKELSFGLENYRMPTIGGYLRCTVYDARGNAAHAENPVIFPDAFSTTPRLNPKASPPVKKFEPSS